MTANNRELGVIFDMDGVLIDTGEFHKQSWFDLAKKENLRMSDEIFSSTFGLQNPVILRQISDRELCPGDIQRMADWKEARYRELIDGKLELLEGARGLIENLKTNGFKLAIGTSTPRVNLEFMLERIPVHDHFDAYVTGEDVDKGKPDPDTFVTAAEKLRLPPSACAVIEDAVHGVRAAKACRMKVVAVTNTNPAEKLHEADIIVDSLAELAAADFRRLLCA